MQLSFDPVDLSQQSKYFEFLAACPAKASDYSFVNLYGWADFYGLEWAFGSDLVWIRQTRPEKRYWAPIGDWTVADLAGDIVKQIPHGENIIRVPETLVRILADNLANDLRVEESRGHWDYLYALPELVDLKGKRFHKKKNLLNQFKKKYDYQYLVFDEKQVGMALGMQENWCTWRDCEAEEALDAENGAITKVLSQWASLDHLEGGAITVDGEMVAYTIGERFADDTLLIHFEKGSPGYKGVYQAINQMFLSHVTGGFEWINREQDLDNDGLRKAKMSYNPVGFLKKYTIGF